MAHQNITSKKLISSHPGTPDFGVSGTEVTRTRTGNPKLLKLAVLSFYLLFYSLFFFAQQGCNEFSVDNGDNSSYPDGICGPGDNEDMEHGRLVVATEQYGSGGGVTVIDMDTTVPQINVALTHDDVTLRWYDNKIWVINRFGADNITILDGDDYRLLKQFSVKIAENTPCNPHDIAFLDRCRLYVSCYEQPFLAIVNPQAKQGEEIIGQIDLSSLADDDGIPEASHMKLTEKGVWVTIAGMRRNHGWVPGEFSYLARIDTQTDTLAQTIALAGKNPVSPIKLSDNGDYLVVSTAGDWSGADAGLELVDTLSEKSEMSISAADLGGIVSNFTLDETNCGFALVTAPSTYETSIKRYCLEPKKSIDSCIPRGSFLITDIALTDDGRLVVTDTSSRPAGVWFYESHDCSLLVDHLIPTGFAPGFTTPLLLVPDPVPTPD